MSTVPSRPSPVSRPAATATATTPVIQATPRATITLDALLNTLVEKGGSDLHLVVGAPAMGRILGNLEPLHKDATPISQPEMEALLTNSVPTHYMKTFEDTNELNFAYTTELKQRFRGNLLRERDNYSAVFRTIPTSIPPFESLGLPSVVSELAYLPRGLVLVTGDTGSGKTTTNASVLDIVNRTREGNIITLEDPIEYVHPHRKCIVRQREVGVDTESYAMGLHNMLRQDPNVILVGEMRNLETISAAITAAETGHLVFSTLHTQSARETISRIVDVFPSSQQNQVITQLSLTLKAVISQTLVRTINNDKRVPVVEVMKVNPAISNQIRTGALHLIDQTIQTGAAEGMQSRNQHLAQLVVSKTISKEEALKVTSSVSDFNTQLETARRNMNSI